MCWLDFEHAGRNALAGDVANFLWYLLGMGADTSASLRAV